MARYAAGTKVPAETSLAEIRGVLARYGCDRFAMSDTPEGISMQFVLDGRPYRLTVDRPMTAEDAGVTMPQHYERYSDVLERGLDMEWRRRFRARLLWLKATLEFAADEPTVGVPAAMAGFLVLSGGATVAEAVERGKILLLGTGA